MKDVYFVNVHMIADGSTSSLSKSSYDIEHSIRNTSLHKEIYKPKLPPISHISNNTNIN